MKKIYLTLILLMFLISCKNAKKDELKRVFSVFRGEYALVVIKNRFVLEVYNSRLEKINSYKIGYGSNPDMKPKLYEGDNRTPEGTYEVNEILSMDAGKESASYKKILNMNRVFFRKSKGYHRYGDPSSDLGDNAYGPRYYGINYPNENDIKRYKAAVVTGEIPLADGKPASIGYGIAIHGNNDEDSVGHLCSSGCIRMYNRDVVDIEKYMLLATPVIIMNE